MNYFPVGKSSLKATYNGKDKKLKGLEIINLASPDAIPNAKFVFHGSLYICGGDINNGFLKRYNDKEWIDIPLPTNYIYNGVVYNGKVHLFGGNSSHYEWDGSTFTQLANTPTNYNYGSAYIVFDEKIHKLGGYYIDGILRYDGNVHYVWDGESWTAVANLPAAMCDARTAVNSNKLYVLGFRYHYNSDSTSYLYKRAYCYSLNTNGVWTQENDVPRIEDDDCLGSAETYNGKIYYVCRSDYSSTYGDAISVYTLNNGVWTTETLGYLGNLARGNALVDYNNRLRIIGHTNAIRLLDGKWAVAQKFPYDTIILPILRE